MCPFLVDPPGAADHAVRYDASRPGARPPPCALVVDVPPSDRLADPAVVAGLVALGLSAGADEDVALDPWARWLPLAVSLLLLLAVGGVVQFGVLAPARTPSAIVEKLSAEIGRILATPEVRQRLVPQGLDPFISTPAQFAELIRAESQPGQGAVFRIRLARRGTEPVAQPA